MTLREFLKKMGAARAGAGSDRRFARTILQTLAAVAAQSDDKTFVVRPSGSALVRRRKSIARADRTAARKQQKRSRAAQRRLGAYRRPQR